MYKQQILYINIWFLPDDVFRLGKGEARDCVLGGRPSLRLSGEWKCRKCGGVSLLFVCASRLLLSQLWPIGTNIMLCFLKRCRFCNNQRSDCYILWSKRHKYENIIHDKHMNELDVQSNSWGKLFAKCQPPQVNSFNSRVTCNFNICTNKCKRGVFPLQQLHFRIMHEGTDGALCQTVTISA